MIVPSRILRSAVALAVAAGSLLAVPPAFAFTVSSQGTWGGPNSEVTEGVATAPDGSLYVTLTTYTFGTTPPSIVLLKYAADGTLLWEQAWEIPDSFFSDQAADVAVAPDGSVYVVGTSEADAVILKFSPAGTLLWQRTWGDSGADAAQDVAIAPDGTVVVSGSTRSFGAGEADAFVLKLDPAGTLIWQRTWGTENVEETGRVAVRPDGTTYLVSTTLRPSGLFEFDAVLVRFDPAGTLLSQTAISAGEITDARGGVTVAPDGSVYVAGGIQGSTSKTVDLDTILLKFTADGTLIWGRQWGGRSGDDPSDVVVGPDGTVYVAGTTDSFGSGGGGDAVLLSVTPDGKGIDASAWGGTGLDRGDGVTLGAGGSIAVAATVEQPPYTLSRAPSRLSRLRATTATALGTVTTPTDTLADPAGVTSTPGGSTTYAGGFDAALVRLLP